MEKKVISYVNYIANRVNDIELQRLKDKSNAHEMWQTLIKRYERKTAISKLMLIRKLISMRMKDSYNLNIHLNNFEILIRECLSAGIDWDQSYWPCFLLGTLPQNYSVIVAAIGTNSTAIEMEEIKSKLLDFYEKYIVDNNDIAQEQSTNSVMHNFKFENSNTNSKNYSFRGRDHNPSTSSFDTTSD